MAVVMEEILVKQALPGAVLRLATVQTLAVRATRTPLPPPPSQNPRNVLPCELFLRRYVVIPCEANGDVIAPEDIAFLPSHTPGGGCVGSGTLCFPGRPRECGHAPAVQSAGIVSALSSASAV